MAKEKGIKITTKSGAVETRGSIGSQDGNSIGDKLKRGRFGLWCCCGVIATVILAALAVGLGVGLTLRGRHHQSSTTPSSTETSPALPTTTTIYNITQNATDYWRPTAGITWQIVLHNPPTNETLDVDVYDIDLFDNNATNIASLQRKHKVICYFSAGSYEDWRSDAGSFKKSDYGEPLDGWNGEYWLDTNSQNVRNIMLKRLDLAVQKGCDGVDPDNVDGYEQNTSFNLTQSDLIDYLTFLSKNAHSRGLAIGLKNGGLISDRVVDFLDWEVNEQCAEYNECWYFQKFIAQDKPVFHIEYPEESHLSVTAMCDAKNSTGFSTVIKKMSLDDWIEFCP